MKTLRHLHSLSDTETLLSDYFAVSEQIKVLEKRKKSLRAHIEPLLIAAEREIVTDEFHAKLSLVSKETLNLKDALITIKREVLAPFIKTTEYNQIRVRKIWTNL